MSKLKGLQTLAEAAGDARIAAKAAGRSHSVLNPPKTGTLDALSDLDEYQQAASRLDKDAPVAQVAQEVRNARETAAETARVDGITNPKGEASTLHQASSPEEFSTRLQEQLVDPSYSAKAVVQSTTGEAGSAASQKKFVEDIAKSRERHTTMVEGILTPLSRDQRWKVATDEWLGDTPYKGDLQFHVDRFSDPTRKDSFIQMDEPREFGLHSGSNEAAERAGLRHGPEDAMQNQATQQQAIAQIASQLEEPLVAIERAFGETAERHFTRLFSKNGDVDVWAEVEEIMEDFVQVAGIPASDIPKFKSGMRQLPTSNTTPFLFRGKNGLLLEDNGGFGTDAVARQLENIFTDQESFDSIQAALGEIGTAPKQKALQKFMESKGFDHIIYHNSVEDKGSLSIINWNPDLMASPWDARFHRNSNSRGAAAASFLAGALGIGGVDAVLREQQQDTT